MNIEEKITKYRSEGFPGVWAADLGNGHYRNPILHTDYSDPDIERVGDDFYMTASSFNNVPGLPILHSRDLVNWKLINYAIKDGIPLPGYDRPQYGKAVWAPAIRYHEGYFYIFVGFPDEGIFMTRTTDPYGEWEPLKCVKPTRGWIDTCPLWDDDGNAYLVNAFAKSRIGFKSVIAITKMKPDGTALDEEEFRIVYDGNINNPTIEGPKLYKRDGWYYISAPAGGVKTGWQLILRSRNIYGPYEEKIVLHQGDSPVNGPHQGGWVDLDNGESWFVHFQDKGAYGRIVHLQPMKWVDGWPVMGVDTNNDGIGEPVMEYPKPAVKEQSPVSSEILSDDFEGEGLSLQWQWNANENSLCYSLTARKSHLRLHAQSGLPGIDKNIWNLPNILTLKFPAPEFTFTVKMEFYGECQGERAGIVIMGNDYFSLNLVKTEANTYHFNMTEGVFKKGSVAEYVTDAFKAVTNTVYLRVTVSDGAICNFYYSVDGNDFTPVGTDYKAQVNTWVGAKAGIFCSSPSEIGSTGYADFDWVLVEEPSINI